MKNLRKRIELLISGISVFILSSCVSPEDVSVYTDGLLSEHMNNPLPKISNPIARTGSLEKVYVTTFVNDKGVLIGNSTGGEIYLYPNDVGKKVRSLLQLDTGVSEGPIIAALNEFVKERTQAQHIISGENYQSVVTSNVGASNQQIITRNEEIARDAYRSGDYLKGDIYSSAASNQIAINQSFGAAQSALNAGANLLGAVNAVQAEGRKAIKTNFENMRNWLVQDSGAIGSSAPGGTHLSTYILHYWDGQKFRTDSRIRMGVYHVLSDMNGNTWTGTQSSDLFYCHHDCNFVQVPASARRLNSSTYSEDILNTLSQEGLADLNSKGFDSVTGFYLYALFTHGLARIEDQLR